MATAIIVAGGRGRRMQADVPKQYMWLGKRPLLSETILSVCACKLIQQVYLVLPAGDEHYCKNNILAPFELENKVQMIAGGKTRQASVFNGLQAMAACNLDDNGEIVVIHDGVRPFIQAAQINACIETARKADGCILALPVQDTLKRVGNGGMIEKTVERKALWMAQTPQTFRFKLIWRAHQKARQKNVVATDDASLIEHFGGTVQVIPGSNWNLKITTPADLDYARILINQSHA
jgi:2-C-methyl-D-erythritol 4-phosphate cytidylyltransferase